GEAQPALPRAGEGVAKPPAGGGGSDQARPDTPAGRGLKAMPGSRLLTALDEQTLIQKLADARQEVHNLVVMAMRPGQSAQRLEHLHPQHSESDGSPPKRRSSRWVRTGAPQHCVECRGRLSVQKLRNLLHAFVAKIRVF